MVDGYKVVDLYGRDAWYNEYWDYLYTKGEYVYKTFNTSI